MAETTGIEWCDSTFNPWVGCVKVGPGCDHCYAETLTKRFGRDLWGQDKAPERTKTWNQPRQWQRTADEFFDVMGRKRRVFCASLADVFDNRIDPEWRSDLWTLIRETPDLIWIILTKRIGNAAKMLPECFPNVWLIATIVNQEEAERDISKLVSIPAVVRGLSMEPLLSPVDLFSWIGPWGPPGSLQAPSELDWIIVGGESGGGARDMDPDWARSIRDQCIDSGTAFLFKQMAHKAPIPADLMIREYPK